MSSLPGATRLSSASTDVLHVLSSLQYRHGELDEYLQTLVHSLASCLQLDAVAVTFGQTTTECLLASSADELYGGWCHAPQLYPRETPLEDAGEAVTTTGGSVGQAFHKRYDACLQVSLQSAHGRVMGNLYCGDRSDRQFTATETCIAKLFAERVASAIDRYLLHRQQRGVATPIARVPRQRLHSRHGSHLHASSPLSGIAVS